MRFSARTWSLLSVLLFVAAAYFWLKGNEIEARKRSAPKAVVTTNAPTSSLDLFSTRSAAQLAQLSTSATLPSQGQITSDDVQANGEVEAEAIRKRYPYRLRNTQKPLKELVRDDKAVLLANALIDTTGQAPEIPEHLRAEGDPGSYIVQSVGAADFDFRARLKEAGAEIVSYVPNNAYFVKLNKVGADRLAGTPGIGSVLPFEPYYKLDPALLSFAVQQEPLPEDAMLRVTFLPGTENVFQEVANLGVHVLAQERSPFGPQLVLRPGPTDLVPLSRLASVQGIERSTMRMPASDISRVVMGVATNGGASNYLGLTGEGVLVNINDTGIQVTHPALTDTTIYLPAPPLGPLMTANNDPDGHGTFVASLIAGSGNQTPSTYLTNTVEGSNGAPSTNIVVQVLPGSDTNASLRGMAPAADLLALPLDPSGTASDVNARLVDTWLIESAAQSNYVALRRTNSLISNNSWTYGVQTYDSSAARFDQAVRDALPAQPLEQPLLFVFAAGNAGFGQEDGFGGNFDSIESPGTAKNVITVGALESPRFITNSFYSITNFFYTTNETDGSVITNEEVENIYPFADSTDSDDEVASFSSRGNVGIGLEGEAGRFKPDVVAPGTMLIAARSAGWNFNGWDTNDTNFGQMFFNLHTNLQPYRFDSGSTFAAANVSGMLALIQEYFQTKAPTAARGPMSPALMKALLINSSRSLNRNYEIAAQTPANYQGWGLPNLPHSLSSYHTNDHSSLAERKHRLRFVEQSPANALSTGQSRTWTVIVNSNAVSFPLRTTLVWTDPPGNPAVAVKLVNDLDLIVTNLDTGLVFYGNNIPVGSDVTVPVEPGIDPAYSDVINNVEQVTLTPALLGQRFSVTVLARRVHVNAVPGHLSATGNRNDVVQDFALVVSSEMGSNPAMNDPDPTNPNGYIPNLDVFDAFTREAVVRVADREPLTRITNGLPLLEERVGANPTLVSTSGITAQWNFYIFTNINETNNFVTTRAGSNVAFVTFNPPNLSKSRSFEADIDLYVSTNGLLTNLNPAALASSFKSTLPGGTESVIFTNARIGEVYYIGVKAEDQEAAEFSLIGVSSDEPFEQERDGRIYLTGVPFEAAVLDGSPRKPTAGTMLAIGLSSRRIANVEVEASTFHENFPDLVGVLSKQRQRAILNNHSFGNTNFGTNTFIYSDNIMFQRSDTVPTDGPGTLNQFAGFKLTGPWFLEMIDNSSSHTGRVQNFTIVVDPLREDIPIDGTISGTVDPNRIVYYPLDVPFGVTNINLTFSVNGQLEFYWREGLLPTTNEFDVRRVINPPGDRFDLAVDGGRTYYMGLRNPGSGVVSFTLAVIPSYADANFNRFFSRRLLDDVFDVATTNSIIDVRDDKLVGDVKVGISMKHPRSSDLAFTLVSPQGSRILLAENRGFTNTGGIGGTTIITNLSTNGTPLITTQASFVIFTDRTNLASTPVKYANPGTSNALGAGVPFRSSFEGSTQVGNYSPNQLLMDGWRVQNGQISIINSPSLAHTGDTLLSLGIGGINRQFAITPGRSYRLRFYAKAGERLDFYSTGVDNSRFPLAPGLVDPHYQRFPGLTYVLPTNQPPFFPPTSWNTNSALSQWIAPYPLVPTNDTTGIFVFRTYINLYENNPATYFRQFKWAADDVGSEIRVNGRFFTTIPALRPTNFNAAGYLNLPVNALELGINTVDFVFNDAGGAEGLRVEVNPLTTITPLTNSANPTAVSTIGGVSTPISAGPNWQLNEVIFVPGSSTESLSFNAGTGEVWIDTVSVESSGDVFLHPEEPFELLEGERAMGEWRLEVRDTRTGAVLPANEILDWSLEIAFIDTRNPADVMQAGDTMGTITLENDQIHYLVLDPCEGATFARFELEGIGNFDELLIFADHSGFPTANSETDDFIPIPNNENPGQANGRATLNLSTLLPAPARLTGKPIYVAIVNQFSDSTNSYRLTFLADGNCSSSGPPPILTPDSPAVGDLDPNPGGGGTNTNDGVFQFIVPASARAATVTVVSDGDVTLYGQKDSIPTETTFTYRANGTLGPGTESLRIDQSSIPPLTPGTYYVRIVNNTAQQVSYTATLTLEFDTTEVPFFVNIIRTSDGNLQLQGLNLTVGDTYAVEATNDLGAAAWATIATRTAASPMETFAVPRDLALRHRFFRLRKI